MLHKGRPVPAAVLGKGGGTVETVFVPIAADDQAVLLIQGQVVLPIDRVAVGVECTVIIAEGIALGVAVFTVAQLQARLPAVIELGIDIAAGAAHGVVGVGFLAEALPGGTVVAAITVVILRLATVIQQVEARLQLIAERMAEVQADGLVAVRIMVAVTGKRRVARVDTGGFIQARAQVEARVFIAARQAQAALPGLVAAKAQFQARLQALLGIAPGKHLNHPANRIAAVNHRT